MESQSAPTQPVSQLESLSDDNSAAADPPSESCSDVPWGRLVSGSASAKVHELCPREASNDASGDGDVYTIGRNRGCDIHIDDSRVSGHHCRVFRCWEKMPALSSKGFVVYVEDMSTNGTFVNKIKLPKHEQRVLSSGDEIALVSPKRDPSRLTVFVFVNVMEKQNEVARPRLPCFGLQPAMYTRSLTVAASDTKRQIELDYDIREELGSGAIGKVYRAVERGSGESWAIKIVPTRQFALEGNLSLDELLHEARMLRKIAHPAIVSVKDVYCNGAAFSIVMQLVEGGDLFDRILEREKYPEDDAREVMRNILPALAYLHERNIVHRDIKPENILLRSMTSDVDVLLTDFGLAKIGDTSSMSCKTFCGTPQYLAPEVLEKRTSFEDTSYDGAAADIWSLGVVLFVLLTGTQPANAEWLFEPAIVISCLAKSFVRQMTIINPALRPSASSMLLDPWLMNTELTAGPRAVADSANIADSEVIPVSKRLKVA